MTKTSYVLSFTAGGLLFHESIVLAEELIRADFDWDVAVNAVKAENLLQSRTQSTAARKLREVRKRLRLLTVDQISLIAEGIRLEQKEQSPGVVHALVSNHLLTFKAQKWRRANSFRDTSLRVWPTKKPHLKWLRQLSFCLFSS